MLAIIEKTNSQVKAFVRFDVPGLIDESGREVSYIKQEGRVFSLEEFQKLPNGSDLLAEYEQRT